MANSDGLADFIAVAELVPIPSPDLEVQEEIVLDFVGFVQILTQLEGVIKRDYLSADYETAEELMGLCALSRNASCEATYPESLQLPWIPQTTSAVALRLLEFDASISYDPQQRTEAELKNKVACLPKPSLGYASLKDPQKVEPTEMDHDGPLREENWGYLRNLPSSSRSKQVVRGRGGGRPRGKLQKGTASKLPESGRAVVRPSETLTQVLIKQGETHGQRHVRGRRTVRKRRIEKKVVAEGQPTYLGDRSSRLSLVVSPRKHVREEFDMNIQGIEAAIDNSNSMEGAESDDSAPENTHEFTRSDLMEMSDEDRGVSTGEGFEDDDEDDDNEEPDNDDHERYRSHGQNLERFVNMDDDNSDRNGDAIEDQDLDSSESEDYSG